MRKIIVFLLLIITCSLYGQTHITYISEKTDSMALINKEDIDIINNVFFEKKRLDSLNRVNDKIIFNLNVKTQIQDSIIFKQGLLIQNEKLLYQELENKLNKNTQLYQQEIKRERAEKISFQALTGTGLIIIILLILL